MQIMDSVERAPKIAFIFYCCCCSDVVSELLKVKIIEFQQNSFRTACNAEPAEIYLYKYIGSTNKENEKHFLLWWISTGTECITVEASDRRRDNIDIESA